VRPPATRQGHFENNWLETQSLANPSPCFSLLSLQKQAISPSSEAFFRHYCYVFFVFSVGYGLQRHRLFRRKTGIFF
jgi:hypothetical protein